MSSTRGSFGSKLGIILAAAGSAVGLGNIWRFPTQAGENGGSAFILVYLLCVICLGLPLMLAECVIGRHSRANTGSAFMVLAPNTNWKWLGRFSVLAAFLILSYYNVVAGWTLAYLYEAVTGTFIELAGTMTPGGANPFSVNFMEFVSDPLKPILFLVIFMLITHVIIMRGVEKGIEKSAKIFMPALFIIVVVLAISALTMPGAKQGLYFLFHPDFSAINSKVILSALGQCFFSLSLGMGCLCTYASYFRKDANLPKTAITVGCMDTFVAIMAGIIIFPAVFSVPGMEPGQGPSLVFIALPNIFNSALSHSPILAWLVPVLFYLLLVFATITSTISLHEVITAFISETFGPSRHKAAVMVSVSTILLGCVCSLSMGPLGDFKIADMVIFDFFDFFTAKIMLPIAAAFFALFVGWKLKIRPLWVELTSHGLVKFKGLRLFLFAVRFVVPVLILLVFLSELNII